MMTKTSLAKELTKPGLSYRDASVYFDVLIDAMIDSLSKGEVIQLRGFGTFYVTKIAARRTNLNGQMSVPEHARVIFRPSDTLKKAVWNYLKDK